MLRPMVFRLICKKVSIEVVQAGTDSDIQFWEVASLNVVKGWAPEVTPNQRRRS